MRSASIAGSGFRIRPTGNQSANHRVLAAVPQRSIVQFAAVVAVLTAGCVSTGPHPAPGKTGSMVDRLAMIGVQADELVGLNTDHRQPIDHRPGLARCRMRSCRHTARRQDCHHGCELHNRPLRHSSQYAVVGRLVTGRPDPKPRASDACRPHWNAGLPPVRVPTSRTGAPRSALPATTAAARSSLVSRSRPSLAVH